MILRWRYQSFFNALQAQFTRRPAETLFVSAGTFLMVAYNGASFYASLVDAGPMLRDRWPRVAVAGLGASALLGCAIGYSLGRWASAKARAPWLTVLPWADAARTRSARCAAVVMGAALTPLAALCGWGVTFAAGAPYPVASGVVTGLAFVVPAIFASLAGTNDAYHTDAPADMTLAAARESWITRVAVALDRSAPRWVGVWAQTGNSTYVSAWWMGSLVVGGGAAGAVSIAQSQPWPSVVVAVAGGNLALMTAVNGLPLLSPVLRSSSVGYAAVWMALIRLPAVLSFAWFAAAALPAVWVSPHFGGEVAGAAPILVLLDTLFCASVALTPSSRRQAALLYAIFLAVILCQGLQYGMAYGVLAVAVVLGVVALLWRQARRRFRSIG